jgi:sialate O-acetylesterase
MTPRRLILLAGLLALAPAARADVKLHPLFTDHMVLQRDAVCPIWGTAAPGENVSVTIESRSDGNQKSITSGTTADDSGRWTVRIGQFTGGAKLTVTVKGTNTVTLSDVLAGDVWICSGQSNMEWKLNQLHRDEQGKKVAAQATHPTIRLFTVPNRPAATPQKDFPVSATEGKWLECKPETAINFSAVGYFFGRDLNKALNVPIGLISADWGGTVCEAWTSAEGLSGNPATKYLAENVAKAIATYDPEKAKAAYAADLERYKTNAAKAKEAGKTPPRPPQKQTGPVHQNSPTALYNGMIAPLVPFAIKGAIWYQGESNAGRAKEYRTLFPTMIADWRKQWGTDFPFLAVQLAPFMADGSAKVSYAELRDAQYHATTVLPKVGLAVITDAGEERDIHPQKKEPVGARLALAARAIAYGEKIEYSGPVYKSMKVDGDQVILTFDHIGGGLVCSGSELTGFTVCGDDKVFKPAKATIKGDTVVVTSGDVAKPVAVRFGWVNFANPELNFFNKAGLPAVPFRTDDFPLTTK